MKKEKKDVKKVIKHLKGDIQTFKKEAAEDRELIGSLHKSRKSEKRDKRGHEKKESAKQEKIETVMREFKDKRLKSSSGAPVKKRDQAVAIAMSEAGIKKKKNK